MFVVSTVSKSKAAALALPVVLLASVIALAVEPDRRLVNAAADQDVDLVKSLVAKKADVNATRPDGTTALLWAAHWNDLQMVDLLLRAGAQVNAADDHGVTALGRAALNGSLPAVERLLAAGADPNLAQANGVTPLMTAADIGSADIVTALLARGASVNVAAVETRTTALMWAVANGHHEVARVLIEAHADVHASTVKGLTPLLYAAMTGDVTAGKMLLAAGVRPDETGSDAMTHALPLAITRGHLAFAQFLLDNGADANSEIDGIPALQAASGTVTGWLGDWTRDRKRLSDFAPVREPGAAERLAMVKALLARGARVNSRINHSLAVLSYVGRPKRGAFDTYTCGGGDLRGASPLWVASQTANRDLEATGGASEIMRTLLAAGADLHMATDDGTTPLMAAAGLAQCTIFQPFPRGRRSIGAEQAVDILVAAGADVNATNEADFTALHGAAFKGLDEIIEFLVKHGADINARDFRGRTPYRLAEASHQSFELQPWPGTAETLKRLGADTRLGLSGRVQERLQDLIADETTSPKR